MTATTSNTIEIIDTPVTTSDVQEQATKDHAYYIMDSPKRIKRKMEFELKEVKKKLKVSQTKLCKCKKSINSLHSLIDALKSKSLVTSQCADHLSNTFSSIPKELFSRLLIKKSGQYPKELRSFAMTLHFYSAKAYNYVRKSLLLSLPHPSVIRKWYSSISGEPGFTTDVFNALKSKVLSGEKVICSLLLDEMAIRKHVEWDGKKFRGCVDVGNNIDNSDSSPIAREAFVLMLVGLNSHWKVPCGYFLVNGLSGDEKANIIQSCILKLRDVGVDVSSVTCDGSASNLTMIRCLGAKIDGNIMPFFLHPADQTIKIPIFLDPCHMIKLVRNTLAELKVLKVSNHNIKWSFIEDLHAIQEKEGLRLGNKLTSNHIHYQNQKMKVNLATQCLSTSIADAIAYCTDHLKIENFQDSHHTVVFIKLFDKLFDILNSRNPIAKGFEAPLNCSNFNNVDTFLTEAENYIRNLKDNNGFPILHSRRKTGFQGFFL